jgi:plasmid stabilization system protein ParE
MSGFVLHPDANNDLNEIWEYIARDNLDAVDRTIEEIYTKISGLVVFPKLGQQWPDLTARLCGSIQCATTSLPTPGDEPQLAGLAVIHGRRNPRVIAAIRGRRE